jgi:hypothetical protein
MMTTATIYTLGLSAGALVVALVLVTAGVAMRAARVELVGEALLFIALATVLFQAFSGKVIAVGWQVPEYWRRTLDMEALAAAYGIILGLGVFTRVSLSAFWVFVVLTFFVQPWAGVVAWTVFALVRGIGFGVASFRHRGVATPPAKVRQAAFVTASVAVSLVATSVVVL